MRRMAWMAAALLLLEATAPAAAEEMVGPFYNERTKSYFALVDTWPNEFLWDNGRGMAMRQSFHGARGRLAMVPQREVDAWVVRTFARQIKHPAIIGLRYWCGIAKLQWIDGSFPSDNNFGQWHTPWYRSTRDSCGNLDATSKYMVVHYDIPQGHMALRASGPHKGYYAYLVEFPTGAP